MSCRLLPRRRCGRARRRRLPGGHNWRPRFRESAGMVRGYSLPGLPLSPRPWGRDGRGARRIYPQADSRRARLCRRRSPRHRRDADSRLSRQPLFLRLSRLSSARASGGYTRPLRRGTDRPVAVRGIPNPPRAIDVGSDRSSPEGEVLRRLARAINTSDAVRTPPGGATLISALPTSTAAARNGAAREYPELGSGWRWTPSTANPSSSPTFLSYT